jgi:quercetin dioxygenase-like cupin family protein
MRALEDRVLGERGRHLLRLLGIEPVFHSPITPTSGFPVLQVLPMTRMVLLVVVVMNRSMTCPIVWKGTPTMNKVSLTALAREHLEAARGASSGRSAHTVYGGHEHSLRQTLIALTAGSELDEHESPGEATLEVLHGRVRVTNAQVHWDGTPGDHIVIPQSRHGLHALEDSAVLLTVVKAVGPHV